MPATSQTKLKRLWEIAFAPYVQAVTERFSFLEARGYNPPQVSVYFRECSVVYWGDRKTLANVAIFHDLGSDAMVSIVPLWMADEMGVTRSFGLREAIIVLDASFEKTHPAWKDASQKTTVKELAWIDWYARFLEKNYTALTNPSTKLLDSVEANRKRHKEWWKI